MSVVYYFEPELRIDCLIVHLSFSLRSSEVGEVGTSVPRSVHSLQ